MDGGMKQVNGMNRVNECVLYVVVARAIVKARCVD